MLAAGFSYREGRSRVLGREGAGAPQPVGALAKGSCGPPLLLGTPGSFTSGPALVDPPALSLRSRRPPWGLRGCGGLRPKAWAPSRRCLRLHHREGTSCAKAWRGSPQGPASLRPVCRRRLVGGSLEHGLSRSPSLCRSPSWAGRARPFWAQKESRPRDLAGPEVPPRLAGGLPPGCCRSAASAWAGSAAGSPSLPGQACLCPVGALRA